jgi:exodeoxyribonuclease VII large subunit
LSAWSVTELTGHIQRLLEDDRGLRDVWVAGEISNLSRSPAGHVYFTLKDAGAALSCVLWRSAAERLAWQPKVGDAALAHGAVSVYAARGIYQLSVDQLVGAGLGDLHARFEQLREQLREEGLFDAARKKPLPPFPRVVGVVTSPQAAALRDVLTVLKRRYPLVRVVVAPTLVQGDAAPPQIASALRALDAHEEVDVLLLVRGGGSLEELWAFNDERVARAVASCRHPVVCGVGHETDFTIADFVADLRAPTPSAAAELVTPDQVDLRQHVRTWRARLEGSAARRLEWARESLLRQQRAMGRQSPRARVAALRQQADDLAGRAGRAAVHSVALRRSGLAGLRARLEALSPLATLERGYAVVRRAETKAVVSSVGHVGPGDALTVRVRDGEFGAEVIHEGHEEHKGLGSGGR